MKLSKSTCFAGSLLLGTLALSGGCGFKTNPVPPQTVVPKPIEDLRYTLDNQGALLTWSYPLETVSGKDINEIIGFDLYRAEIPLEDYCSGCPIPFGEPQELPGGVVAEKKRNTAEHYSGLLHSGNKYFFKVTSRTSWWAASEDSNIVSFIYHTPAAAPTDLKVAMEGATVHLSWSPVTTLIDGSQADFPLGYQVMKSKDGNNYAPLGTPQQVTSFVDTNVKSGKTYYYKVNSSMQYQGETLGGSMSTAVAAEVVDVAPPPQVTGVTVVASANNIRIFWDRVSADDLAGYTVYRRLSGEKNVVKAGKVGATQTIFVDSEVQTGAKVYYSIAAFDKEGNEGERSEEATTRH